MPTQFPSFTSRSHRPMQNSLRGHFLIAGSRLKDANFFKSVILIVEHGPDGAMGLVINHPSPVTVASALQEHVDLPESQDLVYIGGPVEPAALFVIHNSISIDPTEMPVVDGVFMGSSCEVFEEILQASSHTEDEDLRYRVFAGYSGWGPGQLEGELERGDWLTLPAEAEFVFRAEPYEVWDDLLAKSFQAKRLLPLDCEHPEWN